MGKSTLIARGADILQLAVRIRAASNCTVFGMEIRHRRGCANLAMCDLKPNDSNVKFPLHGNRIAQRLDSFSSVLREIERCIHAIDMAFSSTLASSFYSTCLKMYPQQIMGGRGDGAKGEFIRGEIYDIP